MSTPLSTMVEHSSTSASRPMKDSMACSSMCSGICPWAMINRASGTSSWKWLNVLSMPMTLLLTRKHWPPRESSRRMAAAIWASVYSTT